MGPQDDYLPPGLQEHEDSLGHASKEEKEAPELDETGEGSEVFNEDLLDEDDEDGEEERQLRGLTYLLLKHYLVYCEIFALNNLFLLYMGGVKVIVYSSAMYKINPLKKPFAIT